MPDAIPIAPSELQRRVAGSTRVPLHDQPLGSSERMDAQARRPLSWWFWEVSTFPEEWRAAFDHLDELWVASEHIAATMRGLSPVPVRAVGLPVKPLAPAAATREDLGLPGGFVFLFAFDFNSVARRKNATGLVEAFSRAFEAGSGASLVIKTINGDRNAAERDELLAASTRHSDVHLLDGFDSPAVKNAMLSLCDCYVSLHRSEGFGLTLAEAMYFGRPAIATGYSGNLDFMTEENSFLVDHELVPIGPGAEPYPAGGEWAEPDLDHAAALMRLVHDDQAEAARRARRGAEDMRDRHSPAAVGRVLEGRLEEIIALPPREPVADAAGLGPLDLDELRWRATAEPPAAEGLGPLRRGFRKLLLRLLRPYTAHRRVLDTQLLDTVEQLAERDLRALERARREAELLERDTAFATAAAFAELRRLGANGETGPRADA